MKDIKSLLGGTGFKMKLSYSTNPFQSLEQYQYYREKEYYKKMEKLIKENNLIIPSRLKNNGPASVSITVKPTKHYKDGKVIYGANWN